MRKSIAQYNCQSATTHTMDKINHNNQPNHQTRSKMKSKTYGSSYKCHQCRVPLLMVAFIVAIELLLFTNVSHCANAKSYVLHWNTTNPL
ncbi:CLUMA_CG020561, isoform A [Clunio marinus]|uniref:CLUMA_CG020561, isoform A n=1 Tax=Clunio marinus TaxID=568069 RepID=A0A1J1J739_9DIPT|nr:CLUMA_CG020561, isoform A [Clunio marinus]